MIDIFNIEPVGDGTSSLRATFSYRVHVKDPEHVYENHFFKYFKKGANSWIGAPAKNKDNEWKDITGASTHFMNKIRDTATKAIDEFFKNQPDVPF